MSTRVKDKQQNTKERLLTSGALLIAEKGFSGVSVREICQHANTSMNMIHHYFDNKEGLLSAIVEQFNASAFAVPMMLLNKPPKSVEDFQSRLEMLFESSLDAYIKHRVIVKIVMREDTKPGAIVEYMDKFVQFLEQAKKAGYARAELDASLVTGFVLDRIVNQVYFAPWIKENYGYDLINDDKYKKQWCKANLDVFFNGIFV